MNSTDTNIANSLRDQIEKAIKSGNPPETAINDYKQFLNAVGCRQDVENPSLPSSRIATGARAIEEAPSIGQIYATEMTPQPAPPEGLGHSLDKLFHNIQRLVDARCAISQKLNPVRFISPKGGTENPNGCDVGGVSEIDNRIRVACLFVAEETQSLENLADEIRL